MELLKDKNLFFEKEGENIKQFYNMYLKNQNEISKTPLRNHQFSYGPNGETNHQVNEEYFKENVYNWLTGNFLFSYENMVTSPNYYIELYSCFFTFNYYYENHYNLFPSPIYYPLSSKNYLGSDNISFFPLDYNIGYYLNEISWEGHCKNVERTLVFIKENNLTLSKEGKYIENDIRILTELFHKFMKIFNSDNKVTVDELQNFEKEVTEKLGNKEYAFHTVNSLKRNVSYSDKYFSYIIDKNKDFEKNLDNLIDKNNKFEKEIKKLEEIKEEINNLSEENKKTKDFYLTVSGSVMALISLITGNISLVSKEIAVQHIFIFNGSILVAILIFSYLFFSLYTKDTKTYPKKFIDTVGLTIIGFFISLLIYFLWIV
jgi:hypothetical protein